MRQVDLLFMPRLDPHTLDDGIREIVQLLREAGYETFTSCEGGRGHPFREPTVGLKFDGDYFEFRDRLVQFLHSQGRWSFAITLVSSYDQKCPQVEHYVYLAGFDLASAEKRKGIDRSIKQRERRLSRRLGEEGMGERLEKWEARHCPR